MLIPKDLTNLIYSFADLHYPFRYMKLLDNSTLKNHNRIQIELRQAFGPYAWSPTLCNFLVWFPQIPSRPFLELAYSATTRMTPSKKRFVTRYRDRVGYVGIYPGGKQYPTSRCRFIPAFHTNDRYFRLQLLQLA